MIYHIIICDDDSIFTENLFKIINHIMSKITPDYDIKIYNDPDLLLQDISSEIIHCNILLLEILMGEKNGIETAAILRKNSFTKSIVFITNYPQYSLKGYSVYPLNYLLKPVDRDILEEVLLKDYYSQTSIQQLVLKCVGGNIKVSQSDILYFEIRGRKICAVLLDGEIILTGTMKHLESELTGMPFVRCHKGFIVNMQNVVKINRHEIILSQEIKIPVGRSYYKIALECIKRYLKY